LFTYHIGAVKVWLSLNVRKNCGHFFHGTLRLWDFSPTGQFAYYRACGKSSESVQCAITGPCLRMRHRPSAS